jgi:hypothetical protein
MQAIFGRCSRRFGLGMEIPSGPLAFTSRSTPEPLSELEQAMLVAAATSGWNFDIPSHQPADGACEPHHAVPVADATLEINIRGSGKPVLLAQTALTADEFLPLASQPGLADAYQVMLYHRRGYAGSSPVQGPGFQAEVEVSRR